MSDYSDDDFIDEDGEFFEDDEVEEEENYEDEEDYTDGEDEEESDDVSSEELPNGFTKQDYYDAGFTDRDIECWGLDQPGAPGPFMAGFMIGDMQDGSIDGDIDFSF